MHEPPSQQPSWPPAQPTSPPYPAQPYPQAPVPAVTHDWNGMPLSDKSKVAAGLLQLLPGVILGLGGIGRLYAGHVMLGVIQLVATVVGWISFWCGFALVIPFFIFFGCWLWFVIDGVMLLAGRPVDGQGRPLRS